ncbi:hypothetical protein GFH48_09165 [Streptomyces fagopyri]|uniref:PqqD family peptide modification chaperone n=1 Tax=Streptomyces fagopyri TaxID=2662397 RepID=A0A5Q0L8N3_9ACTN|nr:hypothetical protein [Streptomyces fagopyri]QFZ73402.1 hypothetical protein GFH48_09165 [Streptomyces fagopyri]
MAGDGLVFHELSFVPEGDEVVVGRLDTGSYAVFPADGAELLQQLMRGMTLGAAADWYEATFEEEADLQDFVTTLRDLGFVSEADRAQPAAPAPEVRLRGLGRAAFSPPAWALYGALVGGWTWAAIARPDLAPHPGQIFFTHSLLAVQLVITLGQVPLLLLHEGFHILAGRRLGLPTRLSVSNRLTYIVAETQINGLLSVPRAKRYLPFFAGMVCDGVVFSVLGLVADLTRNPGGSFSLTGRLCLGLAFTVAVRMLWQLQLYLRTDLYYVAATAWNCYDLHDAGMTLLKNRVWRRTNRPDRIVDEEKWTPRDRRVGTFYGPFIALGYCAFAGITVFVSIPVTVNYARIAGRALGSGGVDAAFWDAVLSLCMNVAQIAALVVLSRRKRRNKNSAHSLTSSSPEVELS